MRGPALATLSLSLSLLIAGCVTPAGSITTCGAVQLDHPLVVLEQHFGEASGLGRVDEGGCFLEVPDASLSGTGILAAAGKRLFFVDQTQGVLDPIDAKTLGLAGDPVAVFAPGQEPSEPNPHGADVDADGQLWVARFGMGSLAVIDRSGKIAATVDLSDLDPDGLPDMEAVHVEGDRVHVALELLEFNADDSGLVLPRGPGKIVTLDRASRARVGSFDLAGRNPFGSFAPMDAAGSRFAIATPGRIYATDAEDGIDVVDFAQGSARQLISESELGGSATEVIIAGPTEGYAIVAGDGTKSPTSLVRFNPFTGKRDAVLDAATEFLHTGLAIDGGLVLVGDHSAKGAGILAFDRATRAASGRITARRLPPWSLHTSLE
jgi:SMP-30/Gluconolactonase/LRE-like region